MSIDSLRQSLLASGVRNAELVSCVLGMWLFEYKFSKCIVFWSVVDSVQCNFVNTFIYPGYIFTVLENLCVLK